MPAAQQLSETRKSEAIPTTDELSCPVCGWISAQCIGEFDEKLLRLGAECGRCGSRYRVIVERGMARL